MPRFTPSRSNRQRLLAGAATGIVATLAAASLILLENDGAAAAPGPSIASEGEIAAGLLSLGQSYPGGLRALLGLFDTGECAGVASYPSAPPECRSILDQIVQLGTGQPYPERIPDMGDEIYPPDPSSYPPDPSDRVTSEMLAEMEAQGYPADLIEGLRQDPPVIPPAYNTLPNYQGGSSGGSASSMTPLPPTDTTGLPTETTTDTTDTTTDTTTETTTETTETTTTTTTTDPPADPPLLVAVGDSVTSGHEARPPRLGLLWSTFCDDPGTGPATPGSSWAGLLRGMIGVPWNRYFNFAHSGSSTNDVRVTTPYVNPCGVASQPAVPQLGDARAVLARWPSRPGRANVAVATAGVNDTNWVAVATQLVGRNDPVIGAIVGVAPAWAAANRQACIDWVHGNAAGNPGAPPGAVAPAWNGVATSGAISAGVTQIALGLITADPGAQVRYLLYYQWIGDRNLPPACTGAGLQAIRMLNDWIKLGVLVAKIAWAFVGGNANRIDAVCNQLWNPGPNFVQMRLISFGVANNAVLPGWPHPNAAGRAALAGCANGTLPRAPGGGIA